MSKILTRRGLILTAAGALTGVAGHRIAQSKGLIPPDSGGIYGLGETLTYASHRILLAGGAHAREFTRADVSKVAPENGKPPEGDLFQRLRNERFATWRLEIDGLVSKPSSFTLDELKRMPARSQVTQLACEEGWSFIAEWTGTPLAEVLNRAGVLPQARYAVYFSIDPGWWDSIDLPEAWHPQTLLTYGMNGADLSTGHGAPVRLRVPRQLGYKSVKHLARITLTDDLKKFGKGLGSAAPEFGYSWYAGI